MIGEARLSFPTGEGEKEADMEWREIDCLCTLRLRAQMRSYKSNPLLMRVRFIDENEALDASILFESLG